MSERAGEKSCQGCAHVWRNPYGRGLGLADRPYAATLHCRRYPPIRSFDQGKVTASTTEAWPIVDRDWWCGEFARTEAVTNDADRLATQEGGRADAE